MCGRCLGGGGEEGVHCGVGCGVGVGEDPSDCVGPGFDGTEDGVFGVVHAYGFVAFVGFLEFEGDAEVVGSVEKRGGVGNLTIVEEEPEVSEADDFCALGFFDEASFGVFAGSHGEECGTDAKFGDGLVFGGFCVGVEISEYGKWEGFLLCYVGVKVFVTSVLLLEKEACLQVVVEAGVGSVSGTKSLCHVAEGTCDSLCS